MATPEKPPVSEETATIAESSDDKYASDLPPKSNDGPMYAVSGAIALVVLASTGFFYWQNSAKDAQINEIRTVTAGYQSNIDTLKKDPAVRAGELFASQKDAISKAIAKSNAANYLREMEKIEKEYGFFFNGFNFSKNKISTGLIAQKGLDTDAIQKYIRFIASYRNPPKPGDESGSGSQFELAPVLSVGGNEDKRDISVEFTVK